MYVIVFFLIFAIKETTMENITQSDKEVLDKGLEIVIYRYNEELKRSKTFNKSAMYPLSIIPLIFTIISFFLKTQDVIDKHPSLFFCFHDLFVIRYYFNMFYHHNNTRKY